jgi:hypothetical protein
VLAGAAYATKRFALFLLAATIVCGALGLVWALVRGRPVGHSVGLFLFIGAGLSFAVGLGGGVSVRPNLYLDQSSPAYQLRHQREKNQAIADGFGLLALGVILIVLGALAQKYL